METPKVYRDRVVKARRDYRCCECEGAIRRGECYHCFQAVWDRRWEVWRTCMDCRGLRERIEQKIEDIIPFGELSDFVFEPWRGKRNLDYISAFMSTRRKREAPESPNRWMERIEDELIGRDQ